MRTSRKRGRTVDVLPRVRATWFDARELGPSTTRSPANSARSGYCVSAAGATGRLQARTGAVLGVSVVRPCDRAGGTRRSSADKLYNEIERFAVPWLWELMNAKEISSGTVDTTDIRQLRAGYLADYERVHLFAGIGGWDYALSSPGGQSSEPVWTGSCPCGPFSTAGARRGTEDPRHLWPDMFRLIRECRPPTVFGEQVSGALGDRWLAGVFADLESEGYRVASADLPAACVGAPHMRQRLSGWPTPNVTSAAPEPAHRETARVHLRRPAIGRMNRSYANLEAGRAGRHRRAGTAPTRAGGWSRGRVAGDGTWTTTRR